jgi:flagellar biosynthesis protein FliR
MSESITYVESFGSICEARKKTGSHTWAFLSGSLLGFSVGCIIRVLYRLLQVSGGLHILCMEYGVWNVSIWDIKYESDSARIVCIEST